MAETSSSQLATNTLSKETLELLYISRCTDHTDIEPLYYKMPCRGDRESIKTLYLESSCTAQQPRLTHSETFPRTGSRSARCMLTRSPRTDDPFSTFSEIGPSSASCTPMRQPTLRLAVVTVSYMNRRCDYVTGCSYPDVRARITNGSG